MPPLRTLIVDDEPIARRILYEELELLDTVKVVAEADNGGSALSVVASLTPDLVFLDVQMPGMNGLEFLSRLEGPHMPVIVMLTAYDHQATRVFQAGAIDYIAKPVNTNELLSLLRVWLYR